MKPATDSRWNSLLVVVGFAVVIVFASAGLCRAQILEPKSDAERYVLENLPKGLASLELKFPHATVPEDKRQIRGEFLKALLTNRDQKLQFPRGINISWASIVGIVDLSGADIPYDLTLSHCTLYQPLMLDDAHFAKSIVLFDTKFKSSVTFDRGTVERHFGIFNCDFVEAEFVVLKVGGALDLMDSVFDNNKTTFEYTRAQEAFLVHHCQFNSRTVLFTNVTTGGTFLVTKCSFTPGRFLDGSPNYSITDATVSFAGARVGDFFLDASTFERISEIDFDRIHTDLASFDDVHINPSSNISRQQMTFKRLSPMNAGSLIWLLKPYDAEFYGALESSFRAQGYPGEADKIFVVGKRLERRQKCPSLWRQCESRSVYFWSLFQDSLAGYGKHLENLLYWSLGFIVLGAIVFRSEKGMRLKDEKDEPHYAGRYRPFWYSLDLFLPIIKLGEADMWTPREDRPWANFYRRIHIIIGSLFVPIGLAAWTGIIK